MLIRGPRHVRLRGQNDSPDAGADLLGALTPPNGVPLVPDLLDALLDAVSVGIVVQRPDGTPLCVNAAAKALLGSDPVAALAVAAATALRRRRLHQTVLDLGALRSAGGAHQRDSGEPCEVLVTTVPIAPYGGPVAALVSTVSAEADGDVAENKSAAAAPHDPAVGGATAAGSEPVGPNAAGARLQRALLRAEQHMLALTEHSTTGLAALALDGRLLHVNPALARMLGRAADELVGLHLAELDGPDGTPEVALLARLAKGEAERFDVERRYQRPSGETVCAGVTLVAVPDDTGRPGHALLQVTDLTETRLALEMLEHQALHDPLTGLPNRVLGLDRIAKALDRSQRSRTKVAVLTLDLDRFGVVNDSVGPDLGDVVLIEVAERLQLALRAGDTAARLSGDEFAVVCDEVRDEGEAVGVAERVLAALTEPVLLDGRSIVPTASVGIAVSRDDDAAGHHGAAALLRDAGAALHRAKSNGQGGWDLADDELRRTAVDRLDIEGALRSALAGDQLRLHLQPIVDLTTGEVVGREALLRWEHPERGLLPPAWFLPVAEESGLIDAVGRWVLEEAARIAVATPGLGYVAVNVSPSQVRRANLLTDVEDSLKSTGLEPSGLVIELTESVMLGSAPAGRRQLHQLERLGVRLMVDDFGTGFSALSHLRDLPVSGIKVDRTFTAGLGRDRQCDRIVEALTGLAHGLGVDIVAEGVETTQQRDVLAAFGCAHAQGYLFGRPEPVEQ
jgi:diguanylate cyclase (GGDEF)-like protein/PAS domain S-box-containing protein